MESLRLGQRILNTPPPPPPQNKCRIRTDVELGSKKLKERPRYTFGEDIDNL